jgi:hypothetical protein
MLQSSDSQPRPSRSGDGFAPHITTAQLAAALASATGSTNTVSQSPSTSSFANNPVITSEMFNNAIQQAFAGVSSSTPASGASRSTSVSVYLITLSEIFSGRTQVTFPVTWCRSRVVKDVEYNSGLSTGF